MPHVHTAPATAPGTAHRTAARAWMFVCLVGNALLEVLDRARATPTVRVAWPLLTGSGPNAAAVLAIGGAFVALALASPPQALAHWSPFRRTAAAITVTAAGLLLWEAVQPLTARGVFDWWDVGATLTTGAVVVAVAWWLDSPRAGRA